MSTPLITLDNISLAFGIEPLLDKINLQIFEKEQVCIIGRNGAGKSSLLKVIAKSLVPDGGIVWYRPGLRVAFLTQELPQNVAQTVYEYVAEGLANTGKLLANYKLLTHKLSESSSSADLQQLEDLQHAIDVQQGWQLDQTINTILNRLALDPEIPVMKLSGGWQRRAALARALVIAPELLLLDEPTNHLDIEAIQWLENYLTTLGIAFIFITHDRSLLQRLASRIVELDRGQLTSWPGDYANFLRRKEELLQAEAKLNEEFDKKLAQEEVWIRQGIKARRTRNEGRVRALKALRVERAQRREVQGTAKFQTNDAEKSGQLVIEAKNVTQHYRQQEIINNFSIRVMRGDRIGLIGPNGSGKSTLLNILLQKIAPQQGSVTQGTKLQIAYFDQLRQTLALEKTVIDNIVQGSDMIEINGKKKHIISYLSDFLFSPQRALTPVKALSGGECNRLLFAKLFSQPSNLLVLDEPTNDLDIETLELLEELLVNYQGTIILVSHDRAFLNNVITSSLVFEGNGLITEYVGGYDDWQAVVKKFNKAKTVTESAKDKKTPIASVNNQRKLSYKEQKELNELPAKIELMEAKQAEFQMLIASADFYQQSETKITETLAQLKQLDHDLEQAYERWQELEK